MEDKSSMLYWYALINNLKIPMPRTQMVEIEVHINTDEKKFGGFVDKYEDALCGAAEEMGYPLFMRTDHVAGKHDWYRTCFVTDPRLLLNHVFQLVEYSETVDMLGLPVNGIVIREYIEMASIYTAFTGRMPVNPERRYFVRDGKVVCHHPYWVADAIQQGTDAGDLPHNWRELLEGANAESDEEIALLTRYSEMVGTVCGGYWSVDFCLAKDGTWYLIDMAEGEKSWHPEHE